MRSDELRRLLTATPFVPFAVHLKDGRVLPINDPESARVTRDDDSFMAYTSQFDIVYLAEIGRVEVGPVAAASRAGA